jgi:hypothetical protein
LYASSGRSKYEGIIAARSNFPMEYFCITIGVNAAVLSNFPSALGKE